MPPHSVLLKSKELVIIKPILLHINLHCWMNEYTLHALYILKLILLKEAIREKSWIHFRSWR